MKTKIFYYTGTGNSLWVARKVADQLGNTELFSIPESKGKNKTIDSEILGLVFPVYIWGVPAPIIRFAETLKRSRPDYVFAIAVNGGQVSNTLVQLKKILAKNDLNLSTGFSITMPSNYIPWGGPGPKEKQQKRFELAQKKIVRICDVIKDRVSLPVEKGPLWQRVVFSAIYHLSFSHVPGMDKHFWVDDKCDGCEICSRVCPAANITMNEEKPIWHHQCDQCLACLQWCPQEAIQYGKKTPEYERYHHPEVGLKDVLKSW